MRHDIIYHEPGRFAAWPANNGAWVWDGGREALVGFVTGAYREQKGHNVDPPYQHLFARTWDGGETWRVERPATFPGESAPRREGLATALDFSDPNVIVRGIGTGYHGSGEGRGAFAASRDRGATWEGPYPFGALEHDPNLAGMDITARTDIVPVGAGECWAFLSARPRSGGWSDRVFRAILRDGGRTATFAGWVVPPTDPYRAVMSATVRLSPTTLVSAIRRRRTDADVCWIDLYVSEDDGQTWAFRSKVGDTGDANGNPPALVLLNDGRLCCVYGNRASENMLARLSADGGRAWTPETVLRDRCHRDSFGDRDFGYPRAFARPDGALVALYYWSTETHPEGHIARTIWKPE
jgi:hypothetical protein